MDSGRRPQILYLDDDEAVQSTTTCMLERLGCGVRGETDSLKALRTFSEEPDRYDLAILETLMPELSGVELAARFRRIRPDFPVLFYTGRTKRSWACKIEGAGFGCVIFKPVSVQKLGETIRDVLRAAGFMLGQESSRAS